ncbi:hypothetical protein M1N64_02785 [Peptococcaceae bacterium]|nr:hypothetical protein [Peptococcaceae bacterium]
MAKVLREGPVYNQKDVLEVLAEFSLFKDRVKRKFTDLAGELEGKPNEHDLWVNLYLIASDYAEELSGKCKKQHDIIDVQKVS